MSHNNQCLELCHSWTTHKSTNHCWCIPSGLFIRFWYKVIKLLQSTHTKHLGPLLLAWIDFNPSTEHGYVITSLIKCCMKLLIHPQLQQCNHWSWGMNKLFHLTFYNGCDYLSMLGLKLSHVDKSNPWYYNLSHGLCSSVQLMVCMQHGVVMEVLSKMKITIKWICNTPGGILVNKSDLMIWCG